MVRVTRCVTFEKSQSVGLCSGFKSSAAAQQRRKIFSVAVGVNPEDAAC